MSSVFLGAVVAKMAETAAQNVLTSRTMLDPVSKLRVSNPENLIDTDFEYGLQNTKWETLQLVNNVPTFYYRDADGNIPLSNVESVSGSSQITVTTVAAHNLLVGSPFYISGLNEVTVEGYNIVLFVVSPTQFIFRANNEQVTTGSLFDTYTSQLYAARVYQGTQFTAENIVSMETDGADESTVTVETLNPHGFTNNTSLILINSVGQKQIFFDASTDVDVANTVSLVSSIDRSARVAGATGYDNVPVNPYDWEGRKASFFLSSDVDASLDRITIPGHGLTSNDTVMYAAPVGDAPVGGLRNYAPYCVTKIDNDTIQLRGIFSQSFIGLSRYRIDARTNTPRAFTTSLHDIYDQVTDSASTAVNTNDTSLLLAYFIPPTTGSYTFRASAGSECRMTFWWGTQARTDSHTCLYTPSTTNPMLGYEITATNGTATSANISLTAGTWYPIRVQIHGRSSSSGTNSGAFSYSDPLQATFGSAAVVYSSLSQSATRTISAINTSTKVLTTSVNHTFKSAIGVRFTSTSNSIGGLTSGTTYYVRTLSATTFTLHPTAADATNNTNIVQITGTNTASTNFVSANHTYLVTPLDRYTKSASAVDLTSQGTDAYGYHSLHKCYMASLTSGATSGASTNYITVDMNSLNYINAPLTVGNQFHVFNPYVPDPSASPSHPFIPSTFSLHSSVFVNSTDNISRANYVKTYTRNQPVIGQEIVITAISATTITSTSGLTTANLSTAFTTGQRVLFTTTSGSITSLTNNGIYYVRRTGTSTVTLHATLDNAYANASPIALTGTNAANTNRLTSFDTNLEMSAVATGSTGIVVQTRRWNGTMFFVPSLSLETRDSFYVPNHGLQTGYQVQYSVISGSAIAGLNTGSNYLIQKLSDDRVRIMSLTNTEIDIQNIGSGTIQIAYQASNATRDTFYIPNHGLFNTSSVVYNNNGNPNLPGLSNNATYYVWDADTNRFRLSSSAASLQRVDLTGVGSGIHYFTSTNRATDGIAVITNVPEARKMDLSFEFKIPERSVTFDPLLTVNLSSNNLYFPRHQQRTGNRVVYSANGNADVTGLSSDTSYYVIREDLDYFKIAATYENALSNLHVPMTDLGSGSNHVMTFYSVLGEIASSSNIALTAGTSNVSTPNEDLLSTFRIGDRVSFVIPSTPTETTVSAINTTSSVITTTAAHGYVTGMAVKYASTSTSITTLKSGSIFYLNVLTTTTLTLHLNVADATNAENPVALAGTVTANAHKFQRNFTGSTFKSVIKDINNATNMVLADTVPASASNVVFIRTTNLYPRASGMVVHRPYDGGAELIPSNNPDSQIIRQTRKYFRYQSGKGIQISSAVNFSGYVDIENLYRIGSVGYIETKRPHRMTVNTSFGIEFAAELSDGSWNGSSYVVAAVENERLFSFDLSGTLPSETTAGGFPAFFVNTWVDSSIRVGLFDEQNGMFFEYDGSQLYCVRRNSITQLTGTTRVTFNSSRIDGTNTRFLTQLQKGDRIVMKGISYKVIDIQSDLLLYIQPPYRGIDNASVIVSKTIDERFPQSEWNLDKIDGTSASGHVLDIHKIQMCFIDYSWYGAGNVRFGFRTLHGDITYCHQIVHANNKLESYMRSGNMAGRYEVVTQNAPTYVPALLHWGTSVIMDGRFDDDKAYWFTTKGTPISYTGLDRTTFSAYTSPYTISFPKGYLGGQTVTGFAGTYWRITADVTSQFATISNIPNATPLSGTGIAAGTKTVGTPVRGNISGSSVMFVYVDKQPTGTGTTIQTITAGTDDSLPNSIPIASIRLAPSVDNSKTGPIGSREIINRMQLVLRNIGILTTHESLVSLLLNTVPYRSNWKSVESPSLCQVIYHEKGDTVAGGTEIYNFRASGGSVGQDNRRSTASTTEVLESIIDLGNSILGGDRTFPNGPDVLTIAVSVLDTSGISVSTPCTITGRITWTESQA